MQRAPGSVLLDDVIFAQLRDLLGVDAEQIRQNFIGMFAQCRRRVVILNRSFRQADRVGNQRHVTVFWVLHGKLHVSGNHVRTDQ